MRLNILGAFLVLAAFASSLNAQGRVVTRLIWQDDAEKQVRWANLTRGSSGFEISSKTVNGFPALDQAKQSFVQMEAAHGVVVVGIHDDEDGGFQSGWVAINAAVEEEEHGDHSHWHYKQNPSIIASRLDKEQGNPAHLYEYQGDVILANDKKNGFTLVSCLSLLKSPSSQARFFPGGGNHITLAAVDHKVCYATWVDREGDNAGRVDVVPIGSESIGQGYQLKMPSGGLHGATANSGRVFFAPSDGICWVDADTNLTKKPSNVELNHLSLGQDPDTGKPLRTGAFANHNSYVLFTTGSKQTASLCMVDAKSPKPSIAKLPVPIEEGLALTTPSCVKTSSGKQFAFLFSDRRGSEATESLVVVDLDPNGDGVFSDAKIAKRLPVGPSKVEGHGGHHEIAFAANGRLACITNPGDGSIWVLSLSSLEVEGKINVGGSPTRILAIGG